MKRGKRWEHEDKRTCLMTSMISLQEVWKPAGRRTKSAPNQLIPRATQLPHNLNLQHLVFGSLSWRNNWASPQLKSAKFSFQMTKHLNFWVQTAAHLFRARAAWVDHFLVDPVFMLLSFLSALPSCSNTHLKEKKGCKTPIEETCKWLTEEWMFFHVPAKRFTISENQGNTYMGFSMASALRGRTREV